MREINRISYENNKPLKIPNSLLRYFYYFNDLSEECNRQMMLKSEKKSLILLGKYKIEKLNVSSNNTFHKIIFKNDIKKIIIKGSFIVIDNKICYNSRRIGIIVEELE